MIELSPTRRRELRAAAHHLNPVVTVAGNGLTPTVLSEIERSLQAHELIKIKVQGAERKVRDELMQSICDAVEASPVQHIGNILVVWRDRREEESPTRPDMEATAAKSGGGAKAKSASAFAAAARRAAMIKASADKRRSAEKFKRNLNRPSGPGRGK